MPFAIAERRASNQEDQEGLVKGGRPQLVVAGDGHWTLKLGSDGNDDVGVFRQAMPRAMVQPLESLAQDRQVD